TLTATQQIELEAIVEDARGNAAQVQDPRWEASETNVLYVSPNPADPGNPLKCVVKAAGPMDEASLVTFTADADLGDGVAPIIGTLDVIVVSGRAHSVRLSAGAS